METKIQSYKDLIVWKKSIELVVLIYQLTADFPRTEIYGLISQMRRCAVSIASNIAEGKLRGSRKDFRQFLIIAFSSGGELETQLIISKKLGYGKQEKYAVIESLLEEIMKMLNKFIGSLEPNT